MKPGLSLSLDWESATGKDYDLEVSDDARQWMVVQSISGNTKSGWLTYSDLKASGRYVRLHGKTRATAYGFSLWELQVFGS